MEMEEGIEGFMNYLKVERGYSPNTLESYSRDILKFAGFLTNMGRNSWESVRGEDLSAFVAWMQRGGASGRSIARTLSAIRGLFRFLVREGLLKENPAILQESPRPWNRLPESLSHDEVERLLARDLAKGDEDIRDLAILELMYATGIRISELISLKMEDLNFQIGCITVKGKGGKERVVPFGKRAREMLENYIQEVRRRLLKGKQRKHLFLNVRGERLTRQGVWWRLGNFARRAGLARRMTPHLLRHTFATHLLQNGADLRTIQILLGHSDISTTQVYTMVDISHLREVHRRFHPRG